MDIKAITEIIKAASDLLWPILTFTSVLIFRKDIRNLLPRLRKGKIFGNEFELENDVDKLEKEVKQIEANTIDAEVVEKSENNDIDSILKESSKNPKIGMIMLSATIEKEMREWLYKTGHYKENINLPVRDQFIILSQKGLIPANTVSSVKIFFELRNKIVHGLHVAEDDKNIIRVIEIGITLLNAIRSIPTSKNFVRKANIELFSDKEGKAVLVGVTGLMLESVSPAGVTRTKSVYPTTRSAYKIGEEVTWEWNMSNVCGQAFYRDDTTNEIVPAWGSAAEFVGRHLDEI